MTEKYNNIKFYIFQILKVLWFLVTIQLIKTKKWSLFEIFFNKKTKSVLSLSHAVSLIFDENHEGRSRYSLEWVN